MKKNPQDWQLTQEEQDFLDEFEAHTDELTPPTEEEKAAWKMVAENTIKKKNINMRATENDLEKLKARAADLGIGYQTIITALIRQYLSGKIRLEL
jgi:predicted DNA binding CopG/RHH family protein